MHSFTEENYLKAIYALTQKSEADVSTNAIAERVATKAASVTDMLRKLADKQLIHYQKYQGVTLTDAGQRVALSIVRRHRLWEVFLVDKLGFGWHEVHHLAEELEHIQSEVLIDRLEAFLGHPRVDPHGDPIPDQAGRMRPASSATLADVAVGAAVTMTGVAEHSSAFLQYLEKVGLTPQAAITIHEINAFDRSLSLTINRLPPLFVSHEVAKNVLVNPCP